jgi:hypothetical protein
VGLLGCTSDVRLKTTAEALAKGAEECLYDVRDRQLTYEKSPNCSALGALADQYIAAGGFRDDHYKNRSHAFIAESARMTAWMARATSGAGRPLSIW